jgi:hypothetical protein
MAKLKATESGIIDAVLRDYRNGHNHIVPKKYFTELTILEGGIGEGTLVRAGVTAYGKTIYTNLRMYEAEKDRKLVETDKSMDLVTDFTLTPQPGGKTHVVITTEWQAAKGFTGLIEKWLSPGLFRKIYREELQQLNQFMQSPQAKMFLAKQVS